MTHKRFRGCTAWFMVLIGAIAIALYDFTVAIWITLLVLCVAAFLPLIADIAGGA